MNTTIGLKLNFIGYFLRSMDRNNCKLITTLNKLCTALHIPLEKLDQLLLTLLNEGIIAFTRLGINEEQEMQYLFALKTNAQVEELVSLYQTEGKRHHGSKDHGKN